MAFKWSQKLTLVSSLSVLEAVPFCLRVAAVVMVGVAGWGDGDEIIVGLELFD